MSAFKDAQLRNDPIIRASIVRSASRSPSLINEETIKIFSRAISRGTANERNAVYSTLDSNIQLGRKFSKEIRDAVFSDDTYSFNAAKVALRSKAYQEKNELDIDFLDKALQKLISVRRDDKNNKLSIAFDFDELEGWLHSSEHFEKIRAIRLIGLSEQNFVRAYELLIEIINHDDDSEIISEALKSIASSSNVNVLLNLDDVAKIINFTNSEYGNIRNAAIHLLGEVPPLSNVTSKLIEIAEFSDKNNKYKEYEECLSSISNHAEADEYSSEYIFKSFTTEIRKKNKKWAKVRTNKILSLAGAIEKYEPEVPDNIAILINNLIFDHTAPENIRDSFSILFGKIATPNIRNAKLMKKIISRRLKIHTDYTCRSLLNFVRRSKGHINSIRETYFEYQQIQKLLIAQWEVEAKKGQSSKSDEATLNLMRNCIIEIDRILLSFKRLVVD